MAGVGGDGALAGIVADTGRVQVAAQQQCVGVDITDDRLDIASESPADESIIGADR